MFEKKDCYKLGIILKPHGIHGEILLKFDNNIEEKHFELESILVDIDGGLVPFLFETLQQQTNKTMIIKLHLVGSIDEANKVNNHDFYISDKQIDTLGLSKALSQKEIIGFAIIDNNIGEIGAVNDIIDYTNHSVIQAYQNKKEILIPHDPSIVLKIDPNKKQVIVDLPDGLLDVNE